jgi:hypothetical protein
MPPLRPVVPSSLRIVLAAVVAVLVAGAPAGAADSLPTPPEARFTTTYAERFAPGIAPSYSGRCDAGRRCGEAYVFAATRGLRHSGVNPAVAVVLAPATLAVDAVFFPFALALETLAY